VKYGSARRKAQRTYTPLPTRSQIGVPEQIVRLASYTALSRNAGGDS
jgi:hypothetical protein